MRMNNLGSTAFALLASAALTLSACSHSGKDTSPKTNSSTSTLEAAIKGDHRSSENKARDQYRHPQETLSFFEVEPTMHVVEISPGSGWYTEILAPYLKDQGQLTLAIFSDESKVDYRRRLNKTLKEKIKSNPEVYGDVKFTTFDAPETMGPVAPENSADRVLTFRNVHNWISEGQAEAAFQAFYKALKPGGILGVVEHRAPANKKQDPKAKSGYVKEDLVIQLAEKAGFELVAKSEVNANPKDTADHPKGVWTLPPSLRLGEKSKDKYSQIGESDRMTLKFKKVAPSAKD